ncbi:MAG: hypothetical protein PVJ33_02585 [Lysobacterales bacterium]
MRFDDYCGAIDFDFLQRNLERCTAADADHPREVDACAQAIVRNSSCPCIASEESICNALASSISEAMYASGFTR